jgi:hypothetical protein
VVWACASDGGRMSALLTRMREARRGLPVRSSNPFVKEVARALPEGCDEITSVALCDLLGMRPALGNRRKLTRAMAELGWMPFTQKRSGGHWRGAELRGFTRIVRSPRTGARS